MIFHRLFAKLTGKNSKSLPASVIKDQMSEPRPLPTGRQEFEEWSDRIISGGILTADVESQKFALANLLLHLGPTESHKPDAFFIHSLRKFAVNQVADAIRVEIRDAAKARLAAQEAAKASSEVLGNQELQEAGKGVVLPFS
jgi:hypothetical protein